VPLGVDPSGDHAVHCPVGRQLTDGMTCIVMTVLYVFPFAHNAVVLVMDESTAVPLLNGTFDSRQLSDLQSQALQ
jgi:hypothetical protein